MREGGAFYSETNFLIGIKEADSDLNREVRFEPFSVTTRNCIHLEILFLKLHLHDIEKAHSIIEQLEL